MDQVHEESFDVQGVMSMQILEYLSDHKNCAELTADCFYCSTQYAASFHV